MKSIVPLLSLCLLLVSTQSFSQTKVEPVTRNSKSLILDAGASPGILLKSNTGGGSRYLAGVDFRIEKRFSTSVAWSASAGYTHFSAWRNGYFHLKGGIRVYPSVNSTFYFGNDIGVGEYTQGGEVFIYAPSIGFFPGKNWNLNLRFEDYTNFKAHNPSLSLRIAYMMRK